MKTLPDDIAILISDLSTELAASVVVSDQGVVFFDKESKFEIPFPPGLLSGYHGVLLTLWSMLKKPEIKSKMKDYEEIHEKLLQVLNISLKDFFNRVFSLESQNQTFILSLTGGLSGAFLVNVILLRDLGLESVLKNVEDSMLEFLEKLDLSNVNLAFYGGIAGMLSALLYIAEGAAAENRQRYINVASKLVNELKERSIVSDDGLVSWEVFQTGDIPSLGFAWGTTGIAASLAGYCILQKDPAIESIVKGAIRFANFHKDPTGKRWETIASLTEVPKPGKRFLEALCQGTLAESALRILSLEIFEGDEFNTELEDDLKLGIKGSIDFWSSSLDKPRCPLHICCGTSGLINVFHFLPDKFEGFTSKCNDVYFAHLSNELRTRTPVNRFIALAFGKGDYVDPTLFAGTAGTILTLSRLVLEKNKLTNPIQLLI